MQSGQLCNRKPITVRRTDELIRAAQLMREKHIGYLVVVEPEDGHHSVRPVGVITDRDIAVRAVAAGMGPETPIRDVMSAEVKYCFADDEIDEVAHNMADIKVRRLPVLNSQKRLVGIISLADIARSQSGDRTAASLHGISRPGGQHTQGR